MNKKKWAAVITAGAVGISAVVVHLIMRRKNHT